MSGVRTRRCSPGVAGALCRLPGARRLRQRSAAALPRTTPGRIDRREGRPGALSRGRLRGRRHDHDDDAGADADDPRKYRVLSKGNENTVVMTTEPASERGQIMLMKGHDLWIFLPSVSQPVRLSAVAAADRAGRERRPRAGQFRRRLQAAAAAHRKGRRRDDVRARAHRRRPQRHLPPRALLGAASRTTGRTRPSSTRCPTGCSRPACTRNSRRWPGACARRAW